MRVWVLLGAAWAVAGCSVEASGEVRARTAAHAEVRSERSRAIRFELGSPPEPAADVQVVDMACGEGPDDDCDGVDDDCNGVIDDGCGYRGGPVQITLAWRTGADLDLYVTDPLGETISNAHPQSGAGGRMDRHSRGRCAPATTATNVENVHWGDRRPPSGRYLIEVHYWGQCNSMAGPTSATVSVSIAGEVRGVYRRTVSPNDRVAIVRFRIP